MDKDRELWGCAVQVERTYGPDAARFIAERIKALGLAGDTSGVATWTGIADRFAQLQSAKTNGGSSQG